MKLTSLVSTSLTYGLSAYFIWFMTTDLKTFFAAQNTLDGQRTKIRACVISLVLSLVCSAWFSVRMNLTVLLETQRISDLGRDRGGSFLAQGFKPLYGVALMVVAAFAAIPTAIFAWRWSRALDAQGEAILADNCCALAIYSLVLMGLGFAMPLIGVLLGRAGVRLDVAGTWRSGNRHEVE